MINGKFFVGLPPKMMDRNTGPNRQQSKFFWPDESDVDSASECKSKRKHNISQQVSVDSNSPYNTDVEPKELIKNQLTSKVQFYDMDDDANFKSQRNLPAAKSDAPSGQQNKLNTLSSKIQFYDFADDVNAHVPKTDKNSKKDLERNSKNSPKTSDKRITFVEETPIENGFSPPKGILRNNEVNMKDRSVQEQSRKRLIKKRSLSKSVENLSTRSRDFTDDEDDCINVIENDVKNIAINACEPKGNTMKAEEEIVDNRGSRSNFKLDSAQTSRTDYFKDGWESPEQIDENFYRKSGQDQAQVIYHEIQRESREDNEQLQSSRQNINFHKMSSNLNTIGDHFFSPASSPPTQGSTILNNDNRFRREESVKSQNSFPRQNITTQIPSNQSVNNRAHRHLVSNITFGNDIEATTQTPPKSVRNSAVSRVSVGLPD